MSEKTSFHRQGEQHIKGMIKNGRDYYEHIGREPNPRVAEAMAYAAKPLMDSAVESLKLEPNSEGMATLAFPDGTKGLNKEPGVVDEDGIEFSYGEIADNVKMGHVAANFVQTDYYNKLEKAKKLRQQAEELEKEAAEI